MEPKIMSNSTPRAESPGPAIDPLHGYHGKPIVSDAVPGESYVGRVIVELWDVPGRGDESNLAISVDAVDRDQPQLLQRVAAALPRRLTRQPGLLVKHP